MEHLSPSSGDSIRLREEDSFNPPTKVKKVEPILPIPEYSQKQPLARVNKAMKRREMGYGQEVLHPSQMHSDFSSCDFQSINEFSLNKSNIDVRHFNSSREKKFQNRKYEPKFRGGRQAFEYGQRGNNEPPMKTRDMGNRMKYDSQRRVINIVPK